MYDQLQGFLNHPVTVGLMSLMNDRDFTDKLNRIVNHPDRAWVLYYGIVWLVLMFCLRFWRITKADRWYKRLWTLAWTGCLTTVGFLGLIPWVVFGLDYFEVMGRLIRLLLAQAA